jgi:ABC-type transport system substrate-binding protein/class 3 adenylate cyclase
MGLTTGERRIVSVFVVDIADSTDIGERLGPERSKFLFDEVVRLMRDEVERFGGTVAQLTGDGLYALFGAPAAHEDDAERAVRAGLAVHAVLQRYAHEAEEAYGVTLAARVAVNTGPVVLLPEGAPAEERYNALGDTVNVAARLQEHAGPGGVAVGTATARQVEDRFLLEALGDLELKGRREPITAYRVADERETEAPAEQRPLVGRERELALIVDALSGLVEGRGAIVSVLGEPGIGKSRLVAEAKARMAKDVRFAESRAVSYAQEIPYFPVQDLLRSILGVGIAEPELKVRLELKAQLASALGERADTYHPFLASLLGIPLERDAEERLRDLARDSVQRQTQEAVSELLRALSTRRPLCLVLQDLHVADEPTLELYEELLTLCDEEALSLVLVYRSDPATSAWRLGEKARRRFRHCYHELELGPLAPDASAELAAVAAGAELTEEARAALAARAGGNPFFIEEGLRDLIERGALQRENGHLALVQVDEELGLPAGVQETVQARLDPLTPEAREVATIASVVGQRFGFPLLERVAPAEQLRPALSELRRSELVVEERRRPVPEYRFRHGLVQEAAYATLLERRRKELHRVVGEALEDLHGAELSDAFGLLARHFVEADEPEKAAHYSLEAGEAARSVYADEEAVVHYRRALPFLDRMGDRRRARETLFKIALVCHTGFDFGGANEAWNEAFGLPEPEAPRSPPRELVETVIGPPHEVAPGHTYDRVGWWIGRHLFRGLLRLEPGLDVAPDVAEHVWVSDNGRTYRFRLRESVRWSDGEPVTAEDFAFTYRAMREQHVLSAHLLEGVEADALDDRTLELRLCEPRWYFPYLLSQPPFFPWPRHRVQAVEEWRQAEGLVGDGPFTLAQWDEQHVLLVANQRWSGASGNVERVSAVIGRARDELEDWSRGRYDLLEVGRRNALEDPPGTMRFPSSMFETAYLGFRADRFPVDDERVRRALAHALDRERFSELFGWDAPALGGMLPPAMPGHSHELSPAENLERARELLAKAGYADGRGLPALRLALVRPVALSGQFRRDLEEAWRAQWGRIGVRLEIEWIPGGYIAPREDATGPHVWVHGWNADYPDPDGFLATFLETNPVLLDERLETLLGRARTLRNRDERLRLYREADRLLVSERVVAVPTFYQADVVLVRPWIEGFWANPIGYATCDQIVVHDRNKSPANAGLSQLRG